MTKNIGIYLGIIGLLIICLVGAIGAVAYQHFKGPLAPKLEMVTQVTPTEAETISLPESNAVIVTSTPLPTSAPTATTPAVYTCGETGTVNLLVMQRDVKFWVPPYGADSIRLVRVDFDHQKAVVFTLQRDLWLNTPSLKGKYNIDGERLGTIYALVLQHEVNNPEADAKAISAVAQTIYDNFNVAPQQYITLKENTLRDVIDAIGGIEVDIPAAVSREDLRLNAGKQILNGNTAQLYARFMHYTIQEWDRLDRQNLILESLLAKLKDPATILKVPSLLNQFQKNIVTDLSPAQLTDLACMAEKISSNNITFKTIALQDVSIRADGSIYINDLQKIQYLLKDLGF